MRSFTGRKVIEARDNNLNAVKLFWPIPERKLQSLKPWGVDFDLLQLFCCFFLFPKLLHNFVQPRNVSYKLLQLKSILNFFERSSDVFMEALI